MLVDGIETIVGIFQDAQFGPVILLELGGIFVEVLKDHSIRVPPLSREEALQMVREIKGSKLFEDFRGKSKANIKSIVDVLVSTSELELGFKDVISELDINPLIVNDEGRWLKAVDVLVVLKKPTALKLQNTP